MESLQTAGYVLLAILALLGFGILLGSFIRAGRGGP